MKIFKFIIPTVLIMMIILGLFFIGSFSESRGFQIKNTPPNVPSSPDPHSYTTDIDVVLQWSGGDQDIDDVVTYDVFFGTSMQPPKVAGNISSTYFIPEDIEYGKTYYWKILSRDNHGGITEGYLWHFKTESKLNNPPYVPSSFSHRNSGTGRYSCFFRKSLQAGFHS